MITEVPAQKVPKLKLPEYVVDKKLGDITPPWPCYHSFLMFVGKSRSGKSSLLTAILTHRKIYKKKFHNIIICIPMHCFTSMAEESNPFLDLDDEKIYHDFNIDVLDSIYHQILGYASEKENTLLIIDDFASQMKDANLLRTLLMMINNRRHMYMSIFVSVQTYKSVPMALRKTVNVCVLFKINNKAEIKAIYDEIILDMTYDQFIELLNYCFDKPHEYLVVDRDNNLYYKKFNQLIINNNNNK